MKKKVLFLAANPVDTAWLRLGEEVREISAKIRASEHRDSLELISCWAVRAEDVLQALNEHRPHVVHFSGHGSQKEGIVLEDKDGRSKPIAKHAVTNLFKTLADDIRLVVLNACFSIEHAKAITETIDCAVGTPCAVTDTAAVTFAAAFYRALGFGRSVQEAFDQGKAALLLEDVDPVKAPLLFARDGVDPSSLILVGENSKQGRPLDLLHDPLSIKQFYR
jgi:CHAT domain-containing protein